MGRLFLFKFIVEDTRRLPPAWHVPPLPRSEVLMKEFQYFIRGHQDRCKPQLSQPLQRCVLSFMDVQSVVRLDTAIGGSGPETNMMKKEYFNTLAGMRSSAFDCFRYTSLKGLSWVMRRKIDLRDFSVVREKDDRFGTLLHWSCRVDHVDIVKLLVTRSRMSCNAQKANGATPVYVAADSGNLNCIKILIEEGACDAGLPDDARITPLHRAVSNGHLDVAEYLLKTAGVDVDPKDFSGSTPLHHAVRKSNNAMVNLLLQHGANSTIVNVRALSVLDIARDKGIAQDMLALMESQVVAHASDNAHDDK